ncbi:hypothetical protein AB7M17_003801 [Bradyrhizobium sp. USDA 377]
MFSSLFFFQLLSLFDAILVDRALGEKRFAMTNLPKATARFAVQGRRLPWLWCSTAGRLLVACRTDRQQSGATE